VIISYKNQNGIEQSDSYKLYMRGFNVVDLYPRPQNIIEPLFTNSTYRHDKTLWKIVDRFAPKNEKFW